MNRSILFQLLSGVATLRAPDGPGGGGSEPSGGGSTSGTPASAPASPGPGTESPSGASSPAGTSAGSPPGGESPSPNSPQPLPEDPFSGFGATDDLDDDLPQPPAQAAPKPAETPPPQQTPQEQQPPAAAAAAKPPAGQEQPPQPGSPEATAPQLPTPAEPLKMSQHLLANVDSIAQHLATTPEFTMSEADIEAISEDITKALPLFGARMYVRAQAAALSQMERVIPAMVERYMTVSKARDASQQKFYSRWPDLNPADHGVVVTRLAATYRKENPGATLEQMIEELGPLAMLVAKVTPKAGGPQAPTNGQGAPQGVRRPPPSPFVPAVGGPAAIPAPASDDPGNLMGYGTSQDED